MKKKNKLEKACPCGRIISDPKNKTGLCPNCQKKGVNIVRTLALGATGVVALLKNDGGKIIPATFNVARKIMRL